MAAYIHLTEIESMKTTYRFAILTAAFTSMTAQAATPVAPQAYLGFDAGQASHKLVAEDYPTDKAHKTSVKLYGGYNFNANFGVELGSVDLGRFYRDDGDFGVDMKTRAVYAALTGSVPLSAQLSLFGKLGVTKNRTKIKSMTFDGYQTDIRNENGGMFGLGVSYLVVPHVSLVAEYENFGKLYKDRFMHLDVHTFSAGIRYTF